MLRHMIPIINDSHDKAIIKNEGYKRWFKREGQ